MFRTHIYGLAKGRAAPQSDQSAHNLMLLIISPAALENLRTTLKHVHARTLRHHVLANNREAHTRVARVRVQVRFRISSKQSGGEPERERERARDTDREREGERAAVHAS